MEWTQLFTIALGAILVNNFIVAQFLGICPFMGVSKKIETASGMGLAVIFVMGLASAPPSVGPSMSSFWFPWA